MTGLTSADIVRQIRCETRDAATQIIFAEWGKLANDADPKLASIATGLLTEYKENHKDISYFQPEKSFVNYSNISHYMDMIYETSVAYDFDLNMTETNNLNAGFSLLGPMMPRFTMGFTSNFNRQRSNDRTFTVTDTVGKLIKRLYVQQGGGYYCDRQLVRENYLYPIAGNIGVGETITQFYDVAIFNNLTIKDAASAAGGSTPKTTSQSSDASAAASSPSTGPFVDKLTFTTTIDATATPKVTFSPILAANSSTLTAMPNIARTDVHKVTIGVALSCQGHNDLIYLQNFVFSSKGLKDSAKAATCSTSAGKGQDLTTKTLIARPKNDGEELAAKAVDQVRQRELILTPGP